MALTGAPAPVALRQFARLKLRMLANGFRGRPSRVLSFLFGGVFGVYLAGLGFVLFAASGAGDPGVRLMVAAYGGAALVLGSAVLPLVWFGVDDTLDPARFALLPLSRARLVSGLLVAAALGVPGVGLLLATSGLLIPAARHGGAPALAGQVVGILGGLLLCLATARAVTSAFARVLRSRRMRDLAWVAIACLAALLGPAQLLVIFAIEQADWERFTSVARVVGWTPLGAPYTVGFEVAEGRPVVAAAKLAVTAVALGLMLWWWANTLESAMAGATASGPRRPREGVRGGPSAQLLPRLLPGLPARPFGALVAREVRYWWRDARRRSSMIVIVVVGLFMPVLVAAGVRGAALEAEGGEFEFSFSLSGAVSPTTVYLAMLFIGAFATSTLANQFGFDGTAYASHLAIGVPGRLELRARAVAYSVPLVPVLLMVGVVMAVMRGSVAVAPAAWGVLAAGFGVGVAVNGLVSVLASYPLPESNNPFAAGSGDAAAKSMLALLSLLGTGALAVPVLAVAVLLGEAWPWVAVPVGVGSGVGAVLLGTYLAGNLLDRRAPELLASVTPRR
jgi:ABC-2 type transport system permease protein